MRSLLNRLRDEPVPAAIARPRLAEDVAVHEPTEPGLPWVAQRGSRSYLRIGKDLGQLMQAMDGRRDQAALATDLGPPWTPELVERMVHQLSEKRLLDDGRRRRRSTAQWVKFVPPLTIQFTLLRPASVARLLAPIASAFASRWGTVGSVLFVAAGVLALVVQGGLLGEALSSPLPMSVYLMLFVAFLLSMALHEFSHGVALVHYGGRPSRMGLMLFYLTPAFFCDVSDAWRLPHNSQRVRVALAGVAMQWLIGSAAALAALGTGLAGGPTAARYGLLVIAVSNLLAGVLNLIPFVKLDGYIALMTSVDLPHLRDRSIVDGRRLLARWLFGGRYARDVPLRWAPYFGVACMAFPVVLVMMGLSLWLDVLARAGIVGAGLLLAGGGYLAYYLCRGLARMVKEALAVRAHKLRIGAALVGLTGVVALALSLITVPQHAAGGYVVDDEGVHLVLPTSLAYVEVPDGADVVLGRGGLVLQHDTGQAVTTSSLPQEGTAPAAVFVPVELPTFLQQPVLRYPMEVRQPPADAIGVATVHLGDLPLGAWLYATYVAPVLEW